MTFWEFFVVGLFLSLTATSVAISYAELGRSAWRALEVRTNFRAPWLLLVLLSMLWPVTALALFAYEMTRPISRNQHIFMGEDAYRRLVPEVGIKSVSSVHAEWQARVNYFYALGAEAERTGDWLAAQHVATNLDFLLETEPPKPATKDKTVAPAKADRPATKVASTEELWGRIERKAEAYRRETHQTCEKGLLHFCNVCVSQLPRADFRRYQVAGICDVCYDDTHEGDL